MRADGIGEAHQAQRRQGVGQRPLSSPSSQNSPRRGRRCQRCQRGQAMATSPIRRGRTTWGALAARWAARAGPWPRQARAGRRRTSRAPAALRGPAPCRHGRRGSRCARWRRHHSGCRVRQAHRVRRPGWFRPPWCARARAGGARCGGSRHRLRAGNTAPAAAQTACSGSSTSKKRATRRRMAVILPSAPVSPFHVSPLGPGTLGSRCRAKPCNGAAGGSRAVPCPSIA